MGSDEEQETITIQMDIDKDYRGFTLRLDSTCKMDYADIVMAIECWLRENLLDEESPLDQPHRDH